MFNPLEMAQTLYFSLLLIALCSLSECIQRRYHYINISMNWTEAQSYCRKNYTDLATVDNMNDMKQLMSEVNNSRDIGVWIGLTNTGVYKWKWSMGDTVNYTNWETSIRANGNCAYMINGKWRDLNYGNQGFICYNGECSLKLQLTFIKQNTNWRDAQIFCREHHTDLASVRNQNESKQIQDIINNSKISVWIGLFSDSWEWSDQSNFTFRYWKSGEPSIGTDKNCTEVQMNQGQWNDALCSNSQTFVCHEDKLVLINQNLSWSDALSYCRQNHVDLVSVDSEKIQRRVSGLVQKASTPEVWLGLRHSCALGVWFWMNGQMVCYQNWVNSTADKSCDTVRSGAVQSGGDQRWISLPQTELRNFICIKSEK
ncbi:macrophage mannose receptor 1-like isoform X1 [Misgurnus anguillicaudatus]|uniref:macrophage mannose receptor 1-like isoform X1 n=1 Tax=Misgurnus anguillicaudatus TaxID=75329 RepID=UPI003CCFDF23